MPAERVKRKLAAILSADVKGYSRLMGEDEVGTIRTLNIYKEVLTGFIQNHQGRVVGTTPTSPLRTAGWAVRKRPVPKLRRL
jgi:adenylate cyclase